VFYFCSKNYHPTRVERLLSIMKAFPRDIEVQTLKTRHIGVESELYTGDNGYDVPPEVEAGLRKRGLLMSIGVDGGGREYRTNPISVRSLHQVRGEKYLREYYDTLKPVTKVIERGGTHIHISILPDDKPDMELHATALGIAFFRQFQKISGRTTHWADKFYASSLRDLRERFAGYKGRCSSYHRAYAMKGSMLNPTGHGTLEFRGPKGSNDCNEILAWTEFLENVVKAANTKSIEGVKFADLIKGSRIEAYAAELKGWRKLSEADLNRTVNPSAL
jgi:hypothetical protein